MGLTANVVANTPILSTWGNELRDRSVQNFANAAERAAQWAAPPEGAVSYLRDKDSIEFYNGTTWVQISGGRRGARVRRNSAQSIPNATVTAISFDTSVTDIGSDGFLSGGNVVVPAGLAGLYAITAVVHFPLAFWVTANWLIAVNGFAIATRSLDWMRGGTQWAAHDSMAVTYNLSAADIVSVRVWHNSGGPANLGFAAAGDGGLIPQNPVLDVWKVA